MEMNSHTFFKKCRAIPDIFLDREKVPPNFMFCHESGGLFHTSNTTGGTDNGNFMYYVFFIKFQALPFLVFCKGPSKFSSDFMLFKKNCFTHYAWGDYDMLRLSCRRYQQDRTKSSFSELSPHAAP